MKKLLNDDTRSVNSQTTFKELVEIKNLLDLLRKKVESLEQSIQFQAELKDETIEGYACDHCAPERGTAIRRTKIWKLPKILFVMLKRFSPSGAKIQTPFSHDVEADIVFDKHFSSHSPEPSRKKKYSLFATIDHFGTTHGGHYTCQAKNPLTGKWFGYDDESVVDIEKPIVGNSTYIVCFRATS